jgi:hypothetical protein
MFAPLPAVAPLYGLADGVGVGPRVGVGDGAAVSPVPQAATVRTTIAASATRRAGRGMRTGTKFLRND